MKSNERMLNEILRQRDAYDVQRKQRARRTAVLAVAVSLLIAAAVPMALRYRAKRVQTEGAAPNVSAPSSAESGTTAYPQLEIAPGAAVDYAALTGGALPVDTGSGMTCMATFSEQMLKGTAWMIEGTVLEAQTVDHTYVVRAPGKFGAETMTITTPLQSKLTVFRVQRVLHGDKTLEGQTITLEDKLFDADGHFGYKVGTTYILGVDDLGEDALIDHLTGDEVLLSGDLTRKSRYATMYSACVPPIEKAAAANGWIVPACWNSLTKESDADVRLDESALAVNVPGAVTSTLPSAAQTEGDSYVAMNPRGDQTPPAAAYYGAHMKFVPALVFAARLEALLKALF